MKSGSGPRLAIVALFIACLGGVLVWQKVPLQTWYYLNGLASANETDRAHWADRVASLDVNVAPQLIAMLKQGNANLCANAEAAMAALANRWGVDDARTIALAEELTNDLFSFSLPGQEAALEWFLFQIHDRQKEKHPAAGLKSSASKMLTSAAQVQSVSVRVRVLALAEVLLGSGEYATIELCRVLAAQGLASSNAEVRSRAIRLVMHAPLHKDKSLVDRVVPYLQDASPEVRRAAVLTLGLAEETIGVQEMLVLLHDPDTEVRAVFVRPPCAGGLVDSHITLAKLISDVRPGQRLQVVHHLGDIEDLDPGQWLMHLSRDSSPAVRAAAIRFAADDPATADFRERMLQMSREDPSETVRQLAEYYLTMHRRRD